MPETITQILAKDWFRPNKGFEDALSPSIFSISGAISTKETTSLEVFCGSIDQNTIAIVYPAGADYLNYPIIQNIYQSSAKATIPVPKQEVGDYTIILINEASFSEPIALKAIAPEDITPWIATEMPVATTNVTFTGIKETIESDPLPEYFLLERRSTKKLSICGEYFTGNMKAGLRLNGKTEESLIQKIDITFDALTREIKFEVQPISEEGYFNTTKDGLYDLIIDAPGSDRLVKPELIEVKVIPWLDLREGGEEFTGEELTYATRLTMNRDSAGMWFSGDTGWDTWSYLKKLEHPRSQPRTYEWIFTHTTGAMMIGIGGANANPNTTTAYYEAEIVGYFNSQTSFNRFYGDRANGGSSTTVTANAVKKFVLEHNGEGSFDYWIYEIPSADPVDWGDTSNLKGTGVIPTVFNESDSPIAPYFSCHNSTHRLIAVRLK